MRLLLRPRESFRKFMMVRQIVMALTEGFSKLAIPHGQLSMSSSGCHSPPRGRSCRSSAGCPFSLSVCFVGARDQPSARDVSSYSISDGKMTREKLWEDFFSDPTQWSDHRSEKDNPRYPDFKHKRTGQSLWLDNRLTPVWVEAELATLAPSLLQSHIFSWNVRLRRHLKAENYEKTLNLFQQMQLEGMVPDKFTFIAVLNACSNLRSLEQGRCVHEQILQREYESDIYVASCLVDMYAKCGSIADAWSVFNKMRERDVVSWNAMIVGYVKSGQGLKALQLFQTMRHEGVKPNIITFVGVVNACASVPALEQGRLVHKQIVRRGCEFDVYVANGLIDMYAKCGRTEDALSLFERMPERNVVSWNAMIGGYVKSDQGPKALGLFRKMEQGRVEPNIVTFLGVLSACARMVALEEGKRVHKQIVRRGCESNVQIATCLVDMYAKCRSIEDALSVFTRMPERSVVSCNAMIGAFVKSEQGLNALELFRKMQQERLEPDTVTFVGALNACASIAALEEGRHVHEEIIRRGWQFDVYVANCLIDMYAKCGNMVDARSVFNKMRERDVVSWSAIIGGYAMHGNSKKAIGLFKRMGKEGIEIDEITFTCLLSACNHGGRVKEGLRYFKSMTSHYIVLPNGKHFASMVDLLGRAGRLQEAEEMTKRMPMQRDTCMWMSLLGACRIHGNIEMAERAARRCWKLDPENASAHLLLSNIYAAAGKWDRSAAIGKERLKRQILLARSQFDRGH